MTEEAIHIPPPITGYRNLTQTEVDQMNECKELARQVGDLCAKVKALPGIDGRWASIGTTHLQEGFMALIRSIAKPTTF